MARRSLLTDEDILARARSVFVELGYGARTQQIAAAVGLTWGAIALRFSDKRALFTHAMGGPVCGPTDFELDQAGTGDLPSLLQQLRSRLWERWPLRLQYCLATPNADQGPEPDELMDWLAAALEDHAHSGSLRSDMNAKTLAQVVLALLVGDVAQRFVARERTLTSAPTFIDGIVHLLSTN